VTLNLCSVLVYVNSVMLSVACYRVSLLDVVTVHYVSVLISQFHVTGEESVTVMYYCNMVR